MVAIKILAHLNMRLFDIINRMMQYRFYAAITPTVALHVRDQYDIANVAERGKIAEAWNDILQIVKNLEDENYREKFKEACLETMRLLGEDNVDLRHPILQAFYWASFYYNDLRINYYMEEGTLYYNVVRIDRETES